jgi:hypothetical protein
MGKRITNSILAKHGGLHSSRQYALGKKMLRDCARSFTSARLYHICIFGKSVRQIDLSWEATCKELLDRNIDYQWKGAIEFAEAFDDSDHKGLHKHVFVVVDAHSAMPQMVFNQYSNGPWRTTIQKEYGVQFSIFAPNDPMHNGRDYMSLPQSKAEKIEDAVLWISYLYKKNTKPKSGTVYSSSKTSKSKRRRAKSSYGRSKRNKQYLAQCSTVKSTRFPDSIPLDFENRSGHIASVITIPVLSSFEKLKDRYAKQKEERSIAEFFDATDDEGNYDYPLDDPLLDELFSSSADCRGFQWVPKYVAKSAHSKIDM